MGQGKFLMSQKELQRYHVLSKVLEGRMTTAEGAESLGVSTRQMFRLKAKVQEAGPEGLIHGNRGRSPATAKPKALLKKIGDLYEGKYRGFNVSHFTEKLNEGEGIPISRETVRMHLRSENLIGKKRRAPKHRSRRERMPMVGMMLQHDTSEHDWLEGRGPQMKLIASIDDATNEVPYALFVETDGTLPNLEVMKEVVRHKGIPMKFYVDAASANRTTRHAGVHRVLRGDYGDTQIERALRELGINLIIAGSPQAKGRIERLFKTFQDRLISELRLRGIATILEANRFLHEEYLPDYNRRFTVTPAQRGSAYRNLPKRVNLSAVFCIKQERTVQADNTVSYQGRIFQIIPQNRRIGFTRAKVEVQEWTDRSVHVLYKGKELSIRELPRRPQKPKEKPQRFSLTDFLRKEVTLPASL